MANVSVYNMQGQEVGKIDLSDAVFGVEVLFAPGVDGEAKAATPIKPEPAPLPKSAVAKAMQASFGKPP